MKRCIKCGRIPFFCNCDDNLEENNNSLLDEKKQTDKKFQDVCSKISDKKHNYNEIETILQEKGIIGQANFIQSEKNASGIIETYWVNYWIEKLNIPSTMESDREHYETKLDALNGILNAL